MVLIKLHFIFLSLIVSLSLSSPLFLRSLNSSSSQAVDYKFLKSKVFVVFQDDCNACEKQIRSLDCLPTESVKLLGAFSSEQKLKSEVFKWSKFESYYADSSVLKSFKITQKLTPQILVFSERSRKHFLGLTDCKTLLRALMEQG